MSGPLQGAAIIGTNDGSLFALIASRERVQTRWAGISDGRAKD